MLNIYCNPTNNNSFLKNIDFDTLFDCYKTEIVNYQKSHFKQEDIEGKSHINFNSLNYFLAFNYVMLVKDDFESNLYTKEELDKKYCFGKAEKCFSCYGISIDLLFDKVGIKFEDLKCVGINTLGVAYNWQIGYKNCLDNSTQDQQENISIQGLLGTNKTEILLTEQC